MDYEACLEDPTSSCFARLRLDEKKGLYFPVEDGDERPDREPVVNDLETFAVKRQRLSWPYALSTTAAR